MLGGGVHKLSDDVQVVTPESVDNLDLSTAGLLFYDEVHTVSEARAEMIMRATKALRYGLSATPFGRFDNSDKVIEGLFGPVVYQCTYAEAIADGAVVPIKVYWLNCPEPDGWRHYGTHDANYRHGIWRNERMHELVGRLWAAIPEEWQALAIVDKLEHMNGLVPAMNGVTCVHAQNSAKYFEGNSLVANLRPVKDRERDEIYGRMAAGELKRVLSTGIYRQGVNFPQLAILVNLAGMKSDIIAGQLPGRASRPSGDKEYGRIVDFWHPWDTWERQGRQTAGDLLRDDTNREKVYRQLGFEQVRLDLDALVEELRN
jgi:superfamily II DNA or RNA helicase